MPAIKKVLKGTHGRSMDTDKDYTDNDTYIFDDSAIGTYIKV